MNDREQAERVRAAVNRAAFNQHLKEVLESRRIDCVLDVGAHEGGFGKTLRGLGYRDLIVSFEPVESTFEILERAAAEQRPWVTHRFALGDRNEEREINVFAGTDVSSLHEPSAYARSLAPEMLELDRREPVTVRTLDDLLDGWRFPSADPKLLLKIDVQGAEWEVIAGAAETLERIEAVQVEVAVKPFYDHARPWWEVTQRLGEAGFELSGVFPVTRDPQLRIVELDCVLVRSR